MSQYGRSFEVLDSPWRVRDKYNAVSDTSSRPPLLADVFIAPTIQTPKVCARRECVLRAHHLVRKLARGKRLSTANSISSLDDSQLAGLSAPAAETRRKAWELQVRIFKCAPSAREVLNKAGKLSNLMTPLTARSFCSPAPHANGVKVESACRC